MLPKLFFVNGSSSPFRRRLSTEKNPRRRALWWTRAAQGLALGRKRPCASAENAGRQANILPTNDKAEMQVHACMHACINACECDTVVLELQLSLLLSMPGKTVGSVKLCF